MANRLIIVTDHTSFAAYDSIYSLISELLSRKVFEVWIASRGHELNRFFFQDGERDQSRLFCRRIQADLTFENAPKFFADGQWMSMTDFSACWFRLDQPVTKTFWEDVAQYEDRIACVNKPSGLADTSSKQYLLNYPNLVPGIKRVRSFDDVRQLSEVTDIVLKPYRGYGGKGIIRVKRDGSVSSSDVGELSVDSSDAVEAITKLCNSGCIAMDYLKGVSSGDKRIIVFNGEILGAVLRVPAADSWLANVAMGAQSHPSDVTQVERNIISEIGPDLQDKGIYLYGVDTLENNDGTRILSEINVTNVGGLVQIEKLNGISVVAPVVDGLLRVWEAS